MNKLQIITSLLVATLLGAWIYYFSLMAGSSASGGLNGMAALFGVGPTILLCSIITLLYGIVLEKKSPKGQKIFPYFVILFALSSAFVYIISFISIF